MASDLHPYFIYLIGASVNHRDEHLSWNGLILPKDDPWWKRDDEIITKYSSGHPDYVALLCSFVKRHGGIDRVENDRYICGDGLPINIKPKTTFERWAEEDKCRPADWLQIRDA